MKLLWKLYEWTWDLFHPMREGARNNEWEIEQYEWVGADKKIQCPHCGTQYPNFVCERCGVNYVKGI